MAKVSLRIYNREIEALVESGQLEEAIAHCRHILNTFPKHLETYRMIGKAYLEAKRYDEATDIFERVLMAVPDDFVAHVGMSIIRDEQKNMDAAIWHMQRAFEVQPSNAAIQSELQRLYGRRDGIEPPKIRLTRGALAHMYVQGELYPQAISEITSVLEEDHERQDMQVLLARAYFHAGQKSEAAEMCSQLLRRYPYCFDANRVLVELLPQTEQGESVQTYRKRINELNPYTAFVTGSVFHTEEVADAAVNLERLEWDGQPVDMGPEWGEAMGIGLGEKPAAGDQEPDWLKTDLTTESLGASIPTEEPAPASEGLPVPTPSAGGEDEIPDFLREAGWGEDTGTFQEGQSIYDGSDESSEEVPIAEGDLPDWVKAMAPAEAEEEIGAPQAGLEEDLTKDDVPDWLQGIGDAQSVPSEEQSLEKADLPEWLEAEKPAEDEVSEQPAEQFMPESSGDDDIPDWLKSVQTEEEQATPQESPSEAPQEPVQEAAEISEESLSDWQIGDEAAEGPVDFDKTDTGELGTSADEQDDAIAWLEGLASKHGAKPEELVTDPDARTETEPDWVQKAKATKEQVGAETPAAQEQPAAEAPTDLPDFLAEEQAAPVEEPTPDISTPVSQEQPVIEMPADMPDSLAETPAEPAEEPAVDIGDLGASAEEQDDAVAWLESLASKHGAKPEELVTAPEARKETAPEWVQKATEAGAEQPPAEQAMSTEEPADDQDVIIEPTEQMDEDLAAALEDAQKEEPTPTADVDETGMWLQELEQEASVSEEQELTGEAEIPAPAMEDDVPDWLREMEGDAAETEAAPTSGDESPLPDWLSDMDSGPAEAEPASPPTPEEEVEEQPSITDWLQTVDAETSEADAGEPSAEETAEGDLPSWLAGLDEDTEQEEQEQPTVPSDSDLPEWFRAEAEGEPVLPEPTAPTDWKPADAAEPESEVEPEEAAPVAEPEPEAEEPAAQTPPPAAPEPEPEPAPPPGRPAYQEPITRSRTGMTGMLSPAQDPALTEAQNELTRGNIPGAMESYGKLIKKGKMLEEIIFDLREALYRYPVEVTILQTLGDAYMRANRLQEALDSYTKAEELLR